MAVIALTQPTGQEIINVYSYDDGNASGIGIFNSAGAIDNHVTANQYTAPPVIAFAKMKTALTTAGLNWQQLDTVTEYPYAWDALRWICVVEYMNLDHVQAVKYGRDADQLETNDNYRYRVGVIRILIQKNLNALAASIAGYSENSIGVLQMDIIPKLS